MKLYTISDMDAYEIRVHAAECRDVRREIRMPKYSGGAHGPAEFGTIIEVALDWWSDFVFHNDRAMTWRDAVGYTRVLPCCKLPDVEYIGTGDLEHVAGECYDRIIDRSGVYTPGVPCGHPRCTAEAFRLNLKERVS